MNLPEDARNEKLAKEINDRFPYASEYVKQKFIEVMSGCEWVEMENILNRAQNKIIEINNKTPELLQPLTESSQPINSTPIDNHQDELFAQNPVPGPLVAGAYADPFGESPEQPATSDKKKPGAILQPVAQFSQSESASGLEDPFAIAAEIPQVSPMVESQPAIQQSQAMQDSNPDVINIFFSSASKDQQTDDIIACPSCGAPDIFQNTCRVCGWILKDDNQKKAVND
jgi:hypothetical protein